jgi:hypothetical protein
MLVQISAKIAYVPISIIAFLWQIVSCGKKLFFVSTIAEDLYLNLNNYARY